VIVDELGLLIGPAVFLLSMTPQKKQGSFKSYAAVGISSEETTSHHHLL